MPAEFLFLGNGSRPAAASSGTGEAYSAIVLTGKVEPSELAAALESALDPAVPIADFAGNEQLRRDYVGERLDAGGLELAMDKIAPIQRRLNEFPFRAGRNERDELTILRLGVTSRKIVWLFLEQIGLEIVPVLHGLQWRLAAEG